MKALRVSAFLIVAAGACLTGRALYLHAKAELAGVLIRRAWRETLRSGKPHAPWPWADTYPIARLEIPRLGYDEMVLEGATPRTLAFGPARLLDGATPGEPGNLVLAGHRTSWFLPLKDIVRGDRIRLEWFDSRSHQLRQSIYLVSEIRVVDPKDTALLQPTAEDALTLVTCYPFGSRPTSPQRFMVRATPVLVGADVPVASLR
ncbi:MAG: class GN sortase [Actinomycetota bacterium]